MDTDSESVQQAVRPKPEDIESIGEGLAEDESMETEMKEGRVIKGKPRVYQPTEEEIDDHYRVHIPPRAWCKCCRMAKLKNVPHNSGQGAGKNRDVPVVAMDYTGKRRKGKSEEEEEEENEEKKGSLPTIVMLDSGYKWHVARVVPKKGKDPYAI